MTKRILWGVGSSRTLRAHWALVFLDLEYETRKIQTRTPAMKSLDYISVNPQGKIPTLIDGNLTLTESSAIVTYLAERYSSPMRQLIVKHVEYRARYFEWMSFIMMELSEEILCLRCSIRLCRTNSCLGLQIGFISFFFNSI